MSAHTPGPWQVEYGHVGNKKGELILTEIFIRKDGDDVAIASDICDPESGPSEANARLIAAAPELLEALKQVMHDEAPSYHDCLDNGQPECAWCKAFAAIAKATKP